MKNLLNRRLGFLSKILPFFILVGLLFFAYIIFNAHSLSFFGASDTKFENPLKSISSIITDKILYGRTYLNNTHNNEVVIIKIDEKTLKSFSKTDVRMLSFPKELYSNLIIKLIEDYKVSIIGFDIIFSNKSLLGEVDENILRDTFDKYNNKIVIASMPNNLNKPLCKYNNVQHGSIALFLEPRIRKIKLNTNYIVGLGCDSMGNIYSGNDGILESFGFNVYKQYVTNLELNKNKNLTNIFLEIEKENYPYFNINFFNNREKNNGTIGFKSYSLIDILNGDDIDLEGKIVLVGEVGTVLQDNHFTPISIKRKMPGVEINANIITTLLYGYFIKDFKGIYSLLIIVVFSLIILLLIFYNNIIISTLGLIVIIIFHIIYGIFIFGTYGFIYPMFEISYYLFFTYFGMYVYKFFILDKDKRFLKDAFSMFVSPDIVNKISEKPEELKLKGEKTNITVFFSDIESFTSISENMEAEDLFEFLNKYFNKMTKILLKNNGTLDKYIGDAIMGFFNAPLPLEKHEYYACKTALEQISALKELNNIFELDGLPILNIRIGINTGEIVHGNLGARGKRVNYTVIGDDVNLASRLEGVNKIYGTNIIVSESTYIKVENDFIFRELDNISVKGKNKSVKIYELIGSKNSEYNNELLENYKIGLNKYYEGNYRESINILTKNTRDLPSIEILNRCKMVLEGKILIENGIYKINIK